MEDEEAEDRNVKEGFSGDEEIDDVSGKVTKFQKKEKTMILFLISVPILLIFVAASIATFIGVEYLIANYSMGNPIIKLILGIVQGVGITILNLMYTWIAHWFAV
jgi:anoctamin-8